MASPIELQERIKRVKQAIINDLPDMALLNTIAAKALIERNIREKGFGARYSGNELPAWFFEGKEKSKAGEALVKRKKKKGEGMTWADLRVAEGLPIDHVDLSFTNKMWAGMTPLEPVVTGYKVVCPLGGNNQEVVNKMNWNRDRYGDYLGKTLGAKEIEILRAVLIERVTKTIQKNLQ